MTPKPNDREQTRERMRELGRASGRARRKRRSRGFLDVLKARVDSRPEELVDALLGSPPGAVVAARVLEKAGALAPEPKPERHPAARDDIAPSTVGLRDLVEHVYRCGNAHLFGLPTTSAEFERLLATGKGGAPAGESKNHASSSEPLTGTREAAGDPPKPDGTPAPERSSTQDANRAAEKQAHEAAAWKFELDRWNRVNEQRLALGLRPLDANGDAPEPPVRLTPGSSASLPQPEGDSWL
jgi:hypothetical protein